MKGATYIVRVWQEPSDTQKVWRASCTNTLTTKQRQVDHYHQELNWGYRHPD